MTSKTIIAGLVIMAFVAGSIMTGTMADAVKGNPFQEVLDAIAGLQTSVDGIDTSGLATQSSIAGLQTSVDGIDPSGLATQSSVDALQADVDDIKSAQDTQIQAHVVLNSIVCGIATSPTGC